MPDFFRPNIGTAGRLARAGCGVLCLGLAVRDASTSWMASAGWVLLGAFCFFESARGWCIGRACGLKTPL